MTDGENCVINIGEASLGTDDYHQGLVYCTSQLGHELVYKVVPLVSSWVSVTHLTIGLQVYHKHP